MKKYYLLTALIMLLSTISLKLNAQQTNPLINATSAVGLAFNGNDLYVAEYSQKSIFKIDVTAKPIVRKDVFTFQNNDKPLDIAVYNNALYVVNVDDSKTPKVYTISKIDITTKAKTDILTNATYISGIAIRQNELYYSEYYSKKLSKINLTTLAKTDFYTSTTAIKASGIAFNGDESYLYLAHSVGFTRIDVNAPTTLEYVNVTPAGPNRPYEICFNGDDMYSLEVNNQLIFRLNTKGPSPLVKNQLMTTLKLPRQIAYKNKALYILEEDKVSKLDLSCNYDVSKQGNTLTSNYVGGTYQWVDCDNSNMPISGATSQSFTPTKTGNYAVIITATCGSVTSVCTKVCIANKPIVTNNSGVLSTTAANGATYQWLDCNNSNAPISGATANTYTAIANGTYAVEVTSSGGCKDTSDCTTVTVACTTNKPVVTKGAQLLSINDIAGATYQWIDCSTNMPAPGNNFFTSYRPDQNGSYSVVVTRANGCTDTSDCISFCVPENSPLTKSGNTLTSTVAGATYQWLDCNNSYKQIPNETSRSFTPTVSGNYAVQISKFGCVDVSVCATVTIGTTPCTKPNKAVTKNGATLTAAETGATYQWLDCNNSNAPILGATSKTYTATANGSYAVEITSSTGCKDISDCTTVASLGLTENTFASDVKLYPSPTTKDVTIELGDNYNNLTVEITNFLGQVLTNKTIEKVTNRKIVLPINASKGVYFISVKAKEGFARFRIVKE